MSRIEQVRSATDLFSALEEKGKLSKDNLEFLAQLLISIDHANLLSFLSEFPVPNPVPQSTSQDYLYTECLLNIAKGLTSTDVERLVFILGENHLHVSKDHVFSATQLFKMLHQRQLVTPGDVKFMEKTLHEVGRTDLCRYINNYHVRFGQPTHVHATGQEMQGRSTHTLIHNCTYTQTLIYPIDMNTCAHCIRTHTCTCTHCHAHTRTFMYTHVCMESRLIFGGLWGKKQKISPIIMLSVARVQLHACK